MNNWKTGLDKYLTTEPEDNFTPYCEQVLEHIPDATFNANETLLTSCTGYANTVLNKLYDKGYEPQRAAAIMNRLYKNKHTEYSVENN